MCEAKLKQSTEKDMQQNYNIYIIGVMCYNYNNISIILILTQLYCDNVVLMLCILFSQMSNFNVLVDILEHLHD